MKIAYADPPYLGCGKRIYGSAREGEIESHPDGDSWDDPETHRSLVKRLCDEFPDGWAMSLHSPSLRVILPICPEDCRVGAWVKPFCSFKSNVNPAYAWEPVIFRGGRHGKDHPGKGEDRAFRDYCSVPITMQRGFIGAKPEGFSFWIFDLLGLLPTDEFVDLFPGSGAVTKAWVRWKGNGGLFPSCDTVSFLSTPPASEDGDGN